MTRRNWQAGLEFGLDLEWLARWEHSLASTLSGTIYEDVDGDADVMDNGLVVLSGGAGSEIRGLAINNFDAAGGISVWAPVTIAGNFLGTDITGTVAAGNYHGLDLMGSADGTVIGGTDIADRNVISGNVDTGIALFSGADNVTILNNYIGTDVTGTSALGNGKDGIEAFGVSNLVIGQAGAGNVISANLDEGIDLEGVTGATIEGNLIGTDAGGTAALGNGDEGIYVTNATSSPGPDGTAFVSSTMERSTTASWATSFVISACSRSTRKAMIAWPTTPATPTAGRTTRC